MNPKIQQSVYHLHAMNSENKLVIYIEKSLYFLFLLIAFLIPFNRSVPEVGSVMLLLFILYLFVNKKINFNAMAEYKYILLAAGLFFGWVVITSIARFNITEIKNIIRYIGLFCLPVMILSSSTFLNDKRSLYLILYAFISANFIVALYLIIKAFMTGSYWDVEFIALFPILWFPGVLASAIPVNTYLLFLEKNNLVMKTLLSISLLALIVCIYMASRRGGILSVAGSVGLIMTVKLWYLGSAKQKILTGFLIILLPLVLLSNPRFKLIKEYEDYKYDIRLTMWTTAINMVANDPLGFMVGYGIENGYEEYNKRLRAIDYFPEVMKKNFNSAHNDFLDILIIFGAIGLIFFLFFAVAGVWTAYRNKNILFLSFTLLYLIQFTFCSYFFWFRSGKFVFFFLFSFFLLFNNFWPKANK